MRVNAPSTTVQTDFQNPTAPQSGGFQVSSVDKRWLREDVVENVP